MAIVKNAQIILAGLLFIIAVSSVGCTISNNSEIGIATASATLYPTKTPTLTSVSEIKASPTTHQSTHTPQPTPSETPSPTATPSPEPTASPTVEATATLEVYSTQLTGQIVYRSKRIDTNEDGVIDVDDGIHLYLLDVESGETTQLTNGEQRDSFPSLSPDARQISFVSNRNSDLDQVFVMNVDGTETVQISETPGMKSCPEWSPDGKHIAYLVNNFEGEEDQNRIELFSIETGETQTLIQQPDRQLDCISWSPDGFYLVIGYTQDDKSHIAILDLETSELVELNFGGKRSDDPKFLPRHDGLFLSIVQSPGEFSSVSLLIFQLNQDDLHKQPTLLFSIEDVSGRYSWANGGHVLIETDVLGLQKSPKDARSGYEISMTPVDFSTLAASNNGTLSINAFELRSLLTENDFYDDYPDWSP